MYPRLRSQTAISNGSYSMYLPSCFHHPTSKEAPLCQIEGYVVDALYKLKGQYVKENGDDIAGLHYIHEESLVEK